MNRRTLLSLVAVGAALAVCLSPVGGTHALPTLKSSVRYYVLPHPDDEAATWAMAANNASSYPVFVLLTHGDHTNHCDAAEWRTVSYEPAAGELPPVPEPGVNDLPGCDLARLNSWNLFLDQMAVSDPYLDVPAFVGVLPITVGCSGCSRPIRSTLNSLCDQQGDVLHVESVPALTFELHVGVSSARMVFDFGDCDVKQSEVLAAIAQARALTGLGVFANIHQENGLVASAFYNPSQSNGCSYYPHPDHAVVQGAIHNNNLSVPGHQWGRSTQCGTPYAAATTVSMASGYFHTLYDATSSTRPGVFQRTYGWLWDEYWAYAEADSPGTSNQQGPFLTRQQPMWQQF